MLGDTPNKNRGNIHNPERYRARYLNVMPPQCERCGFIPEDECQIDVHHKDGDHRNNDMENFQALCANCHRLVTKYLRHRKLRCVFPIARFGECAALPANCTPIKYVYRPKKNIGSKRRIVAVPR
jgi:hypothetical protein